MSYAEVFKADFVAVIMGTKFKGPKLMLVCKLLLQGVFVKSILIPAAVSLHIEQWKVQSVCSLV